MTWEMPDRDWWRLSLPSFLLGVVLVFVLPLFFTGRDESLLAFRASCQEREGEWLKKSERPTCVLSGGQLLVFGEDAPAGFVVAPDDETMSTTTRCGVLEGSFDQYPVEETLTSVVHRVDFSTWPEATRYRTAIQKDVTRGVNFAGAYVVARWGCPDFDQCEGFAVVSAKTGAVLDYGRQTIGRANFTVDSRLFQATTPTGDLTALLIDGEFISCK